MKTIITWIKWLFQSNIIGILISMVRRLITGRMEIYEIDKGLFQSSKFSENDFATLQKLNIGAIIDLEGGAYLLPAFVGKDNYKYWPIQDIPELPDLKQLDEVAQWGYKRWRPPIGDWKSGKNLLTHCVAGCNRSGLVTGKILILKGLTGKEAVALIRKKRPGALSNFVFANYLEGL